jgi:predicted TIM-barrel fold metal-dependent hydrolase
MTEMPPRSVDAHVHLTGSDFAPAATRAEDPPPEPLAEQLARYRVHLAALGCTRGVLVHSILYGTDNSVTLAALDALGPGFAGVALAPDDVTDATLDALAARRIRALRLNYVHGGVLTWDGARALAPRLAARGMHLEMLARAPQIAAIADQVRALPCPVVFDHCAWPDPRDPGSLDALVALLAEGHAYVKLSAPHRWTQGQDPAPILERLATANPERTLWGSDWPHLMLGDAAPPDPVAARDRLLALLPDETDRALLFRDNATGLYRL